MSLSKKKCEVYAINRIDAFQVYRYYFDTIGGIVAMRDGNPIMAKKADRSGPGDAA